MLAQGHLCDVHAKVPKPHMLRHCTHLLTNAQPIRSITTSCLRRNHSLRNPWSASFLGTAWESHKLAKCLRALDPKQLEGGLVRGASVVSHACVLCEPCCSLLVPKQAKANLCNLCRCGLTIKLSSYREGRTSSGRMMGLVMYSL